MIWGYDKKIWDSLGVKYPLKYPFESYTHVLLTGASGSGKSISTLLELSEFLQDCYYNSILPVVYICDFKNSEDFSFLKGYPLYYVGSACYEGVEKCYQQFTDIRQNGLSTQNKRYLLLIDEYAAACSFFQMEDKLTKGKKAATFIGMVSELLMLGRSRLFGCWLTAQYATADLFRGSRINFMLVISLGRQVREQLNMLFSGEEIPQNRTYQPGEGLLLADGYPLTEVKYPLVDLVQLKRLIRELLFRSIR